MPSFLYTVIVINVFLWWYLVHWMITSRPDSAVNIFTFLFILFCALGLTLTFPFYFYFFKKVPLMTKLRAIYRRSLKWGFFLSSGVTFILGMKAFGVLTIINLILFTVLYYAIYLQLRAKR